jgi:hypothetical protein
LVEGQPEWVELAVLGLRLGRRGGVRRGALRAGTARLAATVQIEREMRIWETARSR